MDLKEAQEILKEHNFTLNEWRYTDDGNRVYEQIPIGTLKNNKQVYLVLSVWGSLKKDKFVKDSVSLNACTKSSYSSFYDTDTELTKKYIPYHIQYKGSPSAIKTWLSKPSCPFEGRTNFVDDIENVMKSATESRLEKIEKDRQTKYETEFKQELSDLLKKYNATLYASSDVYDYGDSVYTTLGVKFSNKHDCELDSTNGDEDAVFA
ncbi:MAG: hypothetical protein J6V44_04510 [Methanobrevibacter sp.]|nr:hypothetical protein [Methanobrevibacter sp.]